jgi:uncharacterized repeat protein (TIGR01451 family)
MRTIRLVLIANLLILQSTVFATTCGTVVIVTGNSLCFGDSTGSAVLTPSSSPDPYWLTLNGAISQFYTTDSLSGLTAGSYTYLITDSVSGCSDTGTFVITGPAAPLFATATTSTACAGALGWAAVTVTGGTPPYIFLWNNGSTSPVQQGLPPGVYFISVLDANGCNTSTTATILPLPPITLTFSVVPPSCNSCNDGSIIANATGGAPPFTYSWNSTSVSGNTLTGVAPGIYNCCVTDANGCQTCDSVLCLGPGYQYVSGVVFYDHNGNGVRDSGETGAANYHIILLPDSLEALSGPSGQYGFFLTNGTYIDSLAVPAGWHTTTASGYQVNLTGNNITGLDFGLYPDNPDAGWAVGYLFPPAPRCLSQRIYMLRVQNTGWGTASGVSALTLDPQMTLVSTSPSADSVIGTSCYFHFDSLNSGQSSYLYVTAQLPAAGSILQLNYRIWTLDSSGALALSDSSCLTQTVLCSYDPNDKAVNPSGTWSTSFIPELVVMDAPLEYTIRFQNTGNDTAYVVVIRDTIDSDLDLSTMEIIGASHPMTANFRSTREVTFTFDNILLPDSNVDEPGSHGFVQYRIRPVPGLPYNTYVYNTAHIFFDANAPIVTNTTISRYDALTGVFNELPKSSELLIYPHPVIGIATVTFEQVPAEGFRLSITDLLGREIHSFGVIRSETIRLDVSSMSSGLYLLRALDISNGTSISRKLIVR